MAWISIWAYFVTLKQTTMKDLIQQAAEDYMNTTLGIEATTFQENLYNNRVTHFLSYAKENGYELLRVEGNEQLVQSIRQKKNAYGHSRSTEQMIEEALTIGAAKEREMLKGVFEKASSDGWWYMPDNYWISYDGVRSKTTDELINLYQNKEG